jgi:hypothetical protein
MEAFLVDSFTELDNPNEGSKLPADDSQSCNRRHAAGLGARSLSE